ncbi:hypothetical protein [Raineyella fluvialis]|uniref:Uncharacterized protein n=1 Tax=Raineyella fluvialis TaxID=2662261 RepID=A0A5Q2FB33_9ACTN|nr:hypothetical protein [Raineyella fluvialis]QGF22614.1 hypothetical protein Rai3103_01770 [Raineyella fluvialis]
MRTYTLNCEEPVMNQVAEAESLDDSRRAVRMAKIVDKLKGDSSKRFLEQTSEDAIDIVAARHWEA